jgi:hypothetical protein
MATKRKQGATKQRRPTKSELVKKIDLAAITHKNAFSKNEFCARNSICRVTFNKWVRAGIGPAFMRVGGRVLVTVEAEREWLQRFTSPPIGRPRKDGAAGDV